MKLFDFIFGKAMERRIAAYQNDLIARHYDEVENMYRQVRGWRHDYHNHIQAMLALIDKPEQMRTYLLTLNEDLTMVDSVIKTGNVMVDAILNSKLSLIKSKDIAVNAKAVVPAELKISDVDLCVIIGNLLDNAMEACEKQDETSECFIRVFIGVLKSQLYISVMNSVGGTVAKDGKNYISTKASGNHGFGLIRVDRIVEKNGGYVNRQNEPGVFATEVMLPM